MIIIIIIIIIKKRRKLHTDVYNCSRIKDKTTLQANGKSQFESHLDVKVPLDFGWIIEGGEYCPKWFYGGIALRAIEITLDEDADTGDETVFFEFCQVYFNTKPIF